MSDGAGNPPANTGGGQAASPWYQGLDQADIGHIQERGLDKLGAPEAAVKLAQMHRAARVTMGWPEDQILRLPKDLTDPDGMKTVWQRLGAPADPKDYSFEGVQAGEATASLVDTMRAAAAGANLPKAAAAQVAKSVSDWLNGQTEAYKTEIVANVQAAETAIKANWGANYEAFNYVANQGKAAMAARVGERLAPQIDQALELMTHHGLGELAREMMRVVGHGLGEDKFVGGNPGSGNQPMNVAMATARKAELMADNAWATRFVNGDTAARREMAALNTIIAGSSA